MPGEKKKKGRKKAGKIVWDILFIISLLVFIVSAVSLIRILLEYKAGTDEYDKLSEMAVIVSEQQTDETDSSDETDPANTLSTESNSGNVPDETQPLSSEEYVAPPMNVDFTSLKAINEDVIGWLYVECVGISYPIVQGPDNAYYLHKTYEGNDNFAGSVFADYQNSKDFSDSNTILYGHNMKNQSMFGKLKLILEQEKYQDSLYFWIFTPEKNMRYRIVSAHYTDASSYVYTIYTGGGSQFTEYLQKSISENALPIEEPDISNVQKMVTLSTCASVGESSRFVVQGVCIQES